MKLTMNWLYLALIILCIAIFSSCSTTSSTKTETTITVASENVKDNNIAAGLISPLGPGTGSPSALDASVPNNSSAEGVELTDQELIDSAETNYEAAIEYLDKGDQDSALDALDKAYSYMLKINGADNPELQQAKEDMRLAISNAVVEIDSSSKSTAGNGKHKDIPRDMNAYV
jgi:hypothetical protein